MRDGATRIAGAIDRLDRAVGGLAKAAAWLAGALLVAMIAHVLLEIALRALFATSTFVLDEFVGYGVAAVTFLSAGYAFQEMALIRVGLLLDAVQRRTRLRRCLEVACAGTTATVLWFIAWYFARSVARHLERGSLSETVAQVPLWIPEGLMLLGLIVLNLRITLYGLKLLAAETLPQGHRRHAEALAPQEHRSEA